MLTAEFHTWSMLHFVTVGACLGLVAMMLLAARSVSPGRLRILRLVVGWGCLAAWVVNTAYWCMPARFTWAGSLPLHICNLANLVGAVAILRRQPLCQGLLYFWTFSLSIWAFLTPTVNVGPAHPGFWVFWIYHLFIALSVAFLLAVDGFRPTWHSLLRSAASTLGYVAVVAALDRVFRWNYGFLGPVVPDAPTPVDFLGPYPLRIIWMVLIGAVAFVILWLPFAGRSPRTGA